MSNGGDLWFHSKRGRNRTTNLTPLEEAEKLAFVSKFNEMESKGIIFNGSSLKSSDIFDTSTAHAQAQDALPKTLRSIEDHGFLYHYAPREARESILEEGLQSSKARTKGALGAPVNSLYFFTDPDYAPSAHLMMTKGEDLASQKPAIVDMYRTKIEPGMLADSVVDARLPIVDGRGSSVILSAKSGSMPVELIAENVFFQEMHPDSNPFVRDLGGYIAPGDRDFFTDPQRSRAQPVIKTTAHGKAVDPGSVTPAQKAKPQAILPVTQQGKPVISIPGNGQVINPDLMAFKFKSHGVTHVFESEEEARRQGWRSSPGKAGDTWSKVGSEKSVSPQLLKATPEEVKASLKGIIGPGSADLSLLPKPIIPVATQTVNDFVAAPPSTANVTTPKAKVPKKKVNRLPHGDPFAKPNKIGKPVEFLPLMPEEDLHKYALKLIVEKEKESIISAHIKKGPFPLPEENLLQRMAEDQSAAKEKLLIEKHFKNNPKGYFADLMEYAEDDIINRQLDGGEVPRFSMDAFYQRLGKAGERDYKTRLRAGLIMDEAGFKADLGVLFEADKEQKLAAGAKNRADLNILFQADKKQKLATGRLATQQKRKAVAQAEKLEAAISSRKTSQLGETILTTPFVPAMEQAEEVIHKAPISKRTMEKIMSSHSTAAAVAAGGLGLIYVSNKIRGEREVGR